ncbi:hypothetical protein G7046_g2379 [Stylonectria norvegica]|nr:hypothetical protein G7046_g2379 [Stylonectria norvegica]
MASQPSSTPIPGPPYPPQGASLGGRPTTSLDVPICAVLIAFFVGGAVFNMTVFQINRRRSHKFVLSGLLFGFCMARITANVLRIVWAERPTNVRVAIAASIFTNAGVLLLFIVNLIFAQRILRAYHPRIGWSRPGTLAFRFLFFSIPANLIMVIVAVVYSFYTLDVAKRTKIRDVQLVATTYLAVLAFLPLPITLLCVLLPRRAPMDKFGQGRMRTKIYLLLFTSTLLALGAGFRCAVGYYKRPADHPMWFHSKPCYYCFNYVIEIIVVYSYAGSRFDRRFHIPDGSKAPGDYSSSIDTARSHQMINRLNTDEEVIGSDERPPMSGDALRQREQDWDSSLKSEINRETV